MALTDLFSIINNELRHAFERAPADPARARRPLLRGIERTAEQFQRGDKPTGKSWWRVRNGVVALTVKVDGDTFDINGVATNHMPVDRFAEFLAKMREAVEAGAFDAELANKGNGDARVRIGKRAATISPEAARARGQKAAATRKANKAARAAVAR